MCTLPCLIIFSSETWCYTIWMKLEFTLYWELNATNILQHACPYSIDVLLYLQKQREISKTDSIVEARRFVSARTILLDVPGQTLILALRLHTRITPLLSHPVKHFSFARLFAVYLSSFHGSSTLLSDSHLLRVKTRIKKNFSIGSSCNSLGCILSHHQDFSPMFSNNMLKN